MNIEIHYPELNPPRPRNRFEAQSIIGKFRVKTFEQLSGRGISFQYTIGKEGVGIGTFVNPDRVGMNVYMLTPKAFENLKKFAGDGVTLEILLD